MVDAAGVDLSQEDGERSMTGPAHPEFAQAMSEASVMIQELHAKLHDTYPPLQGNMAIPGMLVGHGLGAFVANGMPDDQIGRAHV